MTIRELQLKINTDLSSLYPKEEIQSFFCLLISHRLQLNRVDITLKQKEEINKEDEDYFLSAFAELQQEKPIQYIIGETEFYGLPFKVTEDTLIPRPETEELVDWILSEVKNNSKLNILDIGTGTGCIAISLAKNLPKATIYALDISIEALKVAQKNATINNVKINFIEDDILNTKTISNLENKPLEFNIIVSNPPYVRELEKQEIKPNVLANEPHTALFVEDNNPLIFYDKIADVAKKQLTKNGLLFFEINQYLGKQTVDLLKQKGYTNIKLRKDVFENDRMLKVTY